MRTSHLFILLGMIALPAIAKSGPGITPYIAEVPRPDMMKILPPPPAAGSPGDEDDRETFRETRRLQGSARWALATHDVGDDRFANFACAMGMQLSAETAPALAHIFARIGGGPLINPVKDHYARRRPYLDQDLLICEPKTAHLAANGDYPSGHTTAGWSTALVLAELLPERATHILARGRAYGQSRYICGSHSKSAVEAGYMAGASLVATLHASAAFRADMEKARVEMQDLKKHAPAASHRQCMIEQHALMQ
ncbi:phosphatase PAP2 family protein [Sphingobium sp. CR2-8]|uniref:acid phosphatase n=1 Tax=Sphingobium sp. CR2-8 TaxID=1306534 RepID=UPI002DBF1C3D|nr:phosphatase PAP2 family protein [Sphingobium sp. CR2-8]MEC3909421.1 phosphatase PAP2 family protein [Sphingobium sp. CR2-8]